jgi:hypothetical protein
MKIWRRFLTAIIGLSCLIYLPASSAGGEYRLTIGVNALIEGKRLILIDRDSKRWIAADGRYYTRDGNFAIVVKGDEIVVRDLTKEPR